MAPIVANNKMLKSQVPFLNSNDMSEHTPEVRREMYREMAEQKENDEKRKKANQPRERNYDAEHEETVEVRIL